MRQRPHEPGPSPAVPVQVGQSQRLWPCSVGCPDHQASSRWRAGARARPGCQPTGGVRIRPGEGNPRRTQPQHGQAGPMGWGWAQARPRCPPAGQAHLCRAHGWVGQGCGGAGGAHSCGITGAGTDGPGLSWNGTPRPRVRGWGRLPGRLVWSGAGCYCPQRPDVRLCNMRSFYPVTALQKLKTTLKAR